MWSSPIGTPFDISERARPKDPQWESVVTARTALKNERYWQRDDAQAPVDRSAPRTTSARPRRRVR